MAETDELKKPYHKMTGDERLAERMKQNRMIENRTASDAGEMQASSVRSLLERVVFSGQRLTGFTLSEVFPHISRILIALSGPEKKRVSFSSTVDAMVEDEFLSRLLAKLEASSPKGNSKRWWAESMMKWFSQTYTTQKNPFIPKFDRDENAQPYLYWLR